MSDLCWGTVSTGVRRIIAPLGASSLCPRFYLAEGTALALQLGHRRSEDLDLFSADDEVTASTQAEVLAVMSAHDLQVLEHEWGSFFLLADGVRVGFFSYGYELLAPTTPVLGVPLASLLDIGLMKLDAIAGRARRRDFYDLYAIARTHCLRLLFDNAPRKYPRHRDFEAQVVRHLVYFDQADLEPDPELLQLLAWERVKAFFREQAIELARGSLR